MKKMMTLTISAILSVSALPIGSLHAQTKDCGYSTLPAEVRTQLQSMYPAYHIVATSDMDSHERQEWQTHTLTACPGYVYGTFGSGVSGYAISLIRKTGETEVDQMLVFVRQKKSGYIVHVLSPSAKVQGHALIVSTGTHGQYHPLDSSSSLQIDWPVILYEAIDAAIEGYYYAAGSWHSILLSE
jgi:hypothetical protein